MNKSTLELALYKEEEEHARCRRDLRESQARCEQAIDALRELVEGCEEREANVADEPERRERDSQGRRPSEPWRAGMSALPEDKIKRRCEQLMAHMHYDHAMPLALRMEWEDDRRELLRLLSEHHAVGVSDGALVGDKCPICSAAGVVQ